MKIIKKKWFGAILLATVMFWVNNPFSLDRIEKLVTNPKLYFYVLTYLLGGFLVVNIINKKLLGYLFLFAGLVIIIIPMSQLIESTKKEWDFYVNATGGFILISLGIFKLMKCSFFNKKNK